MSTTPAFSLTRFAKFSGKDIPDDYGVDGERTVYFLPASVLAVTVVNGKVGGVRTDAGFIDLPCYPTVEEFEAEINRAVGKVIADQKAYLHDARKELEEILTADAGDAILVGVDKVIKETN